MADTSTHTLMVNGNVILNDGLSELGDATPSDQVSSPREVIAADILQQALQEASEDLDNASVSYESVENAVAVVHGELNSDDDHTYIHVDENTNAQIETVTINSTNKTVDSVSLVDGVHIVENLQSNCEHNGILSADTDVSERSVCHTAPIEVTFAEVPTSTNIEQSSLSPLPLNVSSSNTSENVTTIVNSPNDVQNVSSTTSASLEDSVNTRDTTIIEEQDVESVSITPAVGISLTHLTLAPKSTSAPLGSSENPIQIIQQGNTYHSTQVLTQEQLQQIAQVLQQQQVSKAIHNGGRAVLFDQATNTRIIYRVIYPSELCAKGSNETSGPGSGKNASGRGKGRPRKGWGKRQDEEEGKVNGPDLSREEKEEKKRHRPRTRSGRISRPPSYMVKDYKRIHHLDFDEEPYDDSDGGYSDYQVSDDEGERRHSRQHYLPPGVTTAKQRAHRCTTCDKAYIGRGGLGRHYRLNPSHGSIPETEDVSTQDENSNSSMASSLMGSACPQTPNSNSASENASQDFTNTDVNKGNSSRNQQQITNHQDMASVRRKAKLKEFLRHCRDEELMEVVLPRLAQVITLWEFLLMKSEKGTPAQPYIPDIFKHFENLIKSLQKLAKECLIPASSTTPKDKASVKISNDQVAQALSINTGVYDVKSFHLKEGSLFHYKRLTTNPQEAQRNQTVRRTIEIVSPDEMINPVLSKRRRIEENENSVSSAIDALSANLHDQILNDAVQDVDSLDLSNLNAEGLDAEIVESQPQDSQLLAHSLNPETHNELDSSRELFDVPNYTPNCHANIMNENKKQTLLPSYTTSSTQSEVKTCDIFRNNNTNTVQTLQNIQVRKIEIFDTSQHFESVKEQISAINNKSQEHQENSPQMNTSDFRPMENMVNNNVTNSSAIVTCEEVQNNINHCTVTSTFGPPAAVNVYSTVGNLVSGHIVLDGTAVPDGSNVVISTPSVQHEVTEQNASLANFEEGAIITQQVATSALSHVTQDGDTEHLISEGDSERTHEMVSSEGHFQEENRLTSFGEVVCSEGTVLAAQTTEGTAVIRHLVLPDGQVIGTWSTATNQVEEVSDLGEQIAQGFLPGNVVIVQNSDGSTTLQVPSDQTIPLESLQALLTMDHSITAQGEVVNEIHDHLQVQTMPVQHKQ